MKAAGQHVLLGRTEGWNVRKARTVARLGKMKLQAEPSKNTKENTLRSASKLTLCGAIFDSSNKKLQLAKIEQQISDSDFWNQQPEKAQKIMQERKRLEQSIADEAEVARLTSDLDTLFELGREGENVTADLDREIERFSQRLEVLETGMLLNGPNDAKSAIMAIHPGAGGTESQDWAEMLLRMYLRWAERHNLQAVSERIAWKARSGASNPPRSGNRRRKCLWAGRCSRKSACIAWCGSRRSMPTRGGILRLRRCTCFRRLKTTST